MDEGQACDFSKIIVKTASEIRSLFVFEGIQQATEQ